MSLKDYAAATDLRRQFPMLTSGLTNTMPQSDDQAQIQMLLSQLAQQVQSQQAPAGEQLPQTPGAGQAFLSQLLGNVGSALAQNPQYSQQVSGELGQLRENRSATEQRNAELKQRFDLEKNARLYDISKARLQAKIDELQAAGKEKDAEKLALFKYNLDKEAAVATEQAKQDLEKFKNQLPPSPTENMKEKGRNARANLRSQTTLKGFQIRAKTGKGGMISPDQFYDDIAKLDDQQKQLESNFMLNKVGKQAASSRFRTRKIDLALTPQPNDTYEGMLARLKRYVPDINPKTEGPDIIKRLEAMFPEDTGQDNSEE